MSVESPNRNPTRHRVGIPYASNERGPDGHYIPNVKICPVCGERIVLTHRKDWESFSGREYAAHYASKHEGATTP